MDHRLKTIGLGKTQIKRCPFHGVFKISKLFPESASPYWLSKYSLSHEDLKFAFAIILLRNLHKAFSVLLFF